MTKDFIDELIEVVELKKTVKKSSNVDQVTKAKTFVVAGFEVEKKRVFSEDHRRKISEANKRRVASEETRKKISEAGKGRVVSEETKRKISDWHKGKIVSKNTRRKMREGQAGRDRNRPVMTPNGEFISKEALKERLVADGVEESTAKIRSWFKLYPNDYYYIKKKTA